MPTRLQAEGEIALYNKTCNAFFINTSIFINLLHTHHICFIRKFNARTSLYHSQISYFNIHVIVSICRIIVQLSKESSNKKLHKSIVLAIVLKSCGYFVLKKVHTLDL
jgi:hypothetical protein